MPVLLMLHEVRPIRKTRNPFMDNTPATGVSYTSTGSVDLV